ncbi:MAG: hypothetical protein RSC76_00240 [Oscillospiraceae bacterium]
MQTKGKSYLKIIGGLMAIFGAIGAVIYVVSFIDGGLLLLGSALEGQKAAAVGSVEIMVVFGFGLAWSILELITGITGVINWEKPEKAGLCFKLGIVIAIFAVVANLGQIWFAGFSVTALVSLLVGLILPAGFCYGAKLNQSK